MSDADKRKTQKPSGHVRHDPGGRAVWQWAIDSGRHAIDSTSRLLKKLDLSHLSILDDDERPGEKPPPEDSQPDRPTPTSGGKGGFDPYNSRTPTGRGTAQARPKPPAKPRITQPVRPAPASKQGFFGKLFGGKK